MSWRPSGLQHDGLSNLVLGALKLMLMQVILASLRNRTLACSARVPRWPPCCSVWAERQLDCRFLSWHDVSWLHDIHYCSARLKLTSPLSHASRTLPCSSHFRSWNRPGTKTMVANRRDRRPPDGSSQQKKSEPRRKKFKIHQNSEIRAIKTEKPQSKPSHWRAYPHSKRPAPHPFRN